MTKSFLLIQLISLVAYIIGTFSYWKKKKKDILIYKSISDFLFAIHYGFLGGISAVISNSLSIFRNLLYVKFKNQNRKLSFMFIALYTLFGIIFYKNFTSIIPLIIAIIQTYFLISKKANIIRLSAILCSILWIIYNIYIKSYICIVLELIVIISTVLAICKANKKKRCNKVKN
jgi:hypothetical protein